jgi:hypothetical protein
MHVLLPMQEIGVKTENGGPPSLRLTLSNPEEYTWSLRYKIWGLKQGGIFKSQ